MIRARVRAVALSCLFSTVVTVYVLAIHGQKSPRDIARLLGFWPIDFVDVARVLGLVAILFAGPLYERVLASGRWRAHITGRPLLAELRTEQGLDPDPMAAYLRSGYGRRIAADRVGGEQAGWGA